MMAAIIFMADIATLKQGEGGFTCEFLQMLKKYLIDLSVPNFNVTDCSYSTSSTNPSAHTMLEVAAAIAV